ncbi:YggT family protein [Leuconostocaceae bacterium ESL0723]|nr:YggT family protein [Lactobacillaceae bacterium L1_55_11]WEV54073.1 YggT family protein [Leuconostocaceae bacterium ESL0723]
MLSGILTILSYFLEFYGFAIIIYSLMSWLPGAPESWLGRELAKLVVPYLRLFRFIPNIGPLDFSPIVALMVLWFAQSLLSNLIG